MPLPSRISAGKTFNRWTAIRFVSKQADGSNQRWLFRCSCGNERTRIVGSVVHGVSKSCGCSKKLPRDEKRINLIFKLVKAGAKKRNISFNLLKSDVAKLAIEQQWKCLKTGLPLDFTERNGERLPFGASIDRIDSARGYEATNIQLVCNLYNLAKNIFSDDDVLTFVNALVENHHSSTINRLKLRRVS